MCKALDHQTAKIALPFATGSQQFIRRFAAACWSNTLFGSFSHTVMRRKVLLNCSSLQKMLQKQEIKCHSLQG